MIKRGSGFVACSNTEAESITAQEDVKNWLSLKLPPGYTLGEYDPAVGIDGGALILPEAYIIVGDSTGIPKEWHSAGCVCRMKEAREHFTFENGLLTDKTTVFWNHTGGEKIEVIPGLDRPAILYAGHHDLYTGAQLEELRRQGIKIPESETVSDYWYIYFVEEGKETGYYLSLAQKFFTKEQAIDIARTVKFKE